jgi:hypothetical protein
VFCWDFVDGVWIEIMDIMYDFVGILLNDVCWNYGFNVCFVEILLMDYGLGLWLQGVISLRICWGICDENRCVILLRILYMLRLKVVEISMVKNMKLKIEIYWFWTLMSQAVQSGLSRRPDQNSPGVDQVGELRLFLYGT